MNINRTLFILIILAAGAGYAAYLLLPDLFSFRLSISPIYLIPLVMLIIVLPKAGWGIILTLLSPVLVPYAVLCAVAFGISAYIETKTGYILLPLD
ncbi:MAG: hypothetical protein ABL868_05675 [Sulfuriferula sp.]